MTLGKGATDDLPYIGIGREILHLAAALASFSENRHYPALSVSTSLKNTGIFTRFSDMNSTKAELSN
jgi:hypothetical protein